MQYRVYDRLKLAYIDGGAVRSYSIDNDYINNNNSTIDIIKGTTAMVGDIICLIKDTGAYDKGVITSVDNEALQIAYKSDKELFNDNILNPFAGTFTDETDVEVAGRFGVDVVKNMIELYWGRTTDPFKKLPLQVVTDGDVLDDDGKTKMIWTWSDTEISFVDWLIQLFESYSVIVKWTINFDTAQTVLSLRQPRYMVTISAVKNDSEMIKDNVAMQTITYTKEELPSKTMCIVVDSETKDLLYITSGVNLFDAFYGYEDSYIATDDGMAYKTERINYEQESNVSSYIKVEPNTRYTLSMANSDDKDRGIAYYGIVDGVKKAIGHVDVYNGRVKRFTVPINTPENAKYLRFCYDKKATEIQLEKGDKETTYDSQNKKAIFYLCYGEPRPHYIAYTDNEMAELLETGKIGDIVHFVGAESELGYKEAEYEIVDKSTYKLLTDNRKYFVTTDMNNEYRLLPVRTKYIEYNGNDYMDNQNLTVEEAAANELTPNNFNQAIEIEIPQDSKMFDFELANFGDVYKIITKNGEFTSVYSGRKENSNSNIVTLLFGLGRKNYTDLIQKKMREQRYSAIYNR